MITLLLSFCVLHRVLNCFTPLKKQFNICFFGLQTMFFSIIFYYFYVSKNYALLWTIKILHLRFDFAISELNIFFLLLTRFIFLSLQFFEELSISNLMNSIYFKRIYINCIICFLTHNIFLFIFCFESTALLLLLLIQNNKFEPRRILASYFLFFYTIFGSLPFLFVTCYMYIKTDCFTMNIFALLSRTDNISYRIFRRACFTFFIKLPCFGFYIWLTEAHVEASTAGSIILARLILKIGRYGLIKIVLMQFEIQIILFFQKSFIILFLISFIISCFHLFTHSNMKKIIAFSSIRHMNLRFLSFFCLVEKSYQTLFLFLITHSLISIGLFFIRGKFRNETSQKNYQFLSGIASTAPILRLFFRFFIFSNFNFPLTRNFLPEFFLFINISQYNFYLATIIRILTIRFCSYWLVFLTSICFGTPHKIFQRNLTSVETTFRFAISSLLCIVGYYPLFFFK